MPLGLLPFVDRAGLLASLAGRAARRFGEESLGLSTRSDRAVIVTAPEGAGKRRLGSELARDFTARGWVLVAASCADDGVAPLSGLGEVARGVAARLGPRSDAVAAHRDLLRRVDANEVGSDLDALVVAFLIAAANERPFALQLSELDRASERVRLLVDALLRAIEAAHAPIFVCVTTAPNFKIERMSTALTDERVVDVWNLPPLTAEELGELVRQAFGAATFADELSDRLSALTGGEPFAVQETLRAFAEEGILVEEEGRWTYHAGASAIADLERMLAGRVEARLDAQGAGAWELATILYLMAAPVEIGLLSELTDLRASRFDRLLARLEAGGLVTRGESAAGVTVTLAHHSIREAVRLRSQDSLGERRVELAAAIEELGLDSPAMVALRCELIDDAVDGLAAVETLEQGAATLFAQGQPLLGARLLERVIRRLRHHGGPECLRRLLDVTLTLLGEAYGVVENPRHEEVYYESGVLLAQLLADYRAEALLWLGLADRFAGGKEGIDGAEVALERLSWAARAASLAGDRALALRVAGRRAETLLQHSRVIEADALSREAMAVLELANAEDIDVCNIVGIRIRCLAFLGEFEEAFRLREIARPVAARLPLTQRRTYLSGMSFLCTLSGQYERGIGELEEVVAQTRASDTPRLLISPLHNLGDLYLRLARHGEAAECFREALRLCRLFRMPSNAVLNQGFLGYTLARVGQLDEGATMLREALAASRKIEGAHVTLIQLQLLDAEVMHLEGATEAAKTELERLIRQFRRANETSYAKLAGEAIERISAGPRAS